MFSVCNACSLLLDDVEETGEVVIDGTHHVSGFFTFPRMLLRVTLFLRMETGGSVLPALASRMSALMYALAWLSLESTGGISLSCFDGG